MAFGMLEFSLDGRIPGSRCDLNQEGKNSRVASIFISIYICKNIITQLFCREVILVFVGIES
ncbi:hypothetical protein D3C75_1154000 [compost metagenome]